MITGEALDVILRIQGLRGFQAGMRQAASSTASIGRAAVASSAQSNAAMNKQLGMMALVRKAAIGIGIASAAAGLEAYKLQTNFDKQLAMVQSEAGASAAEVANMRKEILNLAGPLQQNPEELAKGLYHIESLGFRGAKALAVLKDSAHMANISGADLEETTTALGGAMIVGVRGAGSLTNTMGTLIATAGAGNMRMQNLVDALGTGLLSAAKNANMTLLDTGAALATLTDTGMPASSAAAQLRTALHFLYSPTERARKALGVLGLSQRDLVEQIEGPNGLAGALSMLDMALDRYAGNDNAKRLNLFGHILPGGRGQVLLTLMKNLDQYEVKNKQIARTISHTGTGIRVAETTNAAKLRGAWADLQAVLISVADTYGDDLTSVIVVIIGLLASLAAIVRDNKNTIVNLSKAVAIAVGIWATYRGILIAVTAATWLWDAATGAMMILSLVRSVRSLADAWLLLDMAMEANPAVLIGTAIIAIGLALIYAYNHVKWFHNAVDDVFNFIKTHWKLLGAIMLLPFAPLAGAIFVLVTNFKTAFHLILEAWNATVGQIHFKIPGWVPGIGGNSINLHVDDPTQKGPRGGGPGPRPPRVRAAAGGAGANVFTTPVFPATHGPGGRAVVIPKQVHEFNIFLDSRQITAKVNKNNADRKARKGNG
jgi:TP901 family phage tail tape measure protein